MTTARWLVVFLVGAFAVALVILACLYAAELGRPVHPPIPGALVSAHPASDSLPVGLRDAGSFLRVRDGVTFRVIAQDLMDQGWVRHPWVLRMEARRRRWDRHVIPGWYRYREGETIRALLARLAHGEIEETRVTIPEGWRLRRILAMLAESTWVSAARFQMAARDTSWLASQDIPGPGLEGYLMPDSYRIARGAEPASVLDQLTKPGRDFWMDSLAAAASGLGWSRRDVWTLASIIEAEAATEEERPRISAVFHNRLRLGMRLESDPTVLYALGRPPGRVLYADLEVESLYNTYRHPGLPPGPICSPGRSALRAAVHPQPDCRDLFFMARGDGTHVFSRTLAEHNWNRRVLRARS
jgi:UPF0755 protein